MRASEQQKPKPIMDGKITENQPSQDFPCFLNQFEKQQQPDKACWRIFGSQGATSWQNIFHIECKAFDSYPKTENQPAELFHVFSINLRNSSRGGGLIRFGAEDQPCWNNQFENQLAGNNV